jgi:4-diphosphocytidyl-2-C-methyl-D-erythritol kinase
MIAMELESLGTSAEVSIHIDKRLPIQGGLGAGSANAIAALIGLEVELGLPPTTAPISPGTSEHGTFDGELEDVLTDIGKGSWPGRQLQMAEQVGSDVPLFLIGGAVLGRDHGQNVYPLPDLDPIWCVVALPPIGVSTPQAFRDWDTLCATEGLTADASEDRLEQLSRAYVSAFAGAIPRDKHGSGSSGVPALSGDLAGPQESALVRTGISSWIQNDFERVVFPQHPSLAEIKRLLAAAGTPEAALHASLSGSGSALFGLYLARKDAQAALDRLTAAGVQGQITRTLPRSQYWAEMIVQKLD